MTIGLTLARKNSTARVIRRPRGFGSEAMPIPDCFAGCVDTAKKEAEKLKCEMMVKRSQGIEMDQKVIAMMNSTITSPKVREQCYAWRKEIAGFKVVIKKTRQQAAKLGKSSDKHGERMLLFQKKLDLSRRLLDTNKKLVKKFYILDMGDKAKEMSENPGWFELLCDKDDIWALNDLRSARLKIKKVK